MNDDSKRRLRMASCMAPNADPMCRALARYLARALERPVEWVDAVPWDERERLLDAGEIDLCWICGLPYVEKADRGDAIALCVAPVMSAPRYRNDPIYFSDGVVRADSPYRSFADLQNESWAYNEPRSHSGFNLVRYHLVGQGRGLDYFGRLVEAGSHQAALDLVVSGEVAGAAIDSTVLEAEMRRRPGVEAKIRVLLTLGPSPSPPWVFSAAIGTAERRRIAACLAEMHRCADGAAVLAQWGIAELRRVDDADYDPIRRMTRVALDLAAQRPVQSPVAIRMSPDTMPV